MGKRIQLFEAKELIAEYELGSEAFTIGRAPENFICLNHSSISGRHVRVIPTMLDPVIEDLGSTIGTFVNGKRLAGPYVLRSGDTIKLPKFSIRYVRDDKKPADRVTEATSPHAPAPPPDKSDFAAWWEQRKRSQGRD